MARVLYQIAFHSLCQVEENEERAIVDLQTILTLTSEHASTNPVDIRECWCKPAQVQGFVRACSDVTFRIVCSGCSPVSRATSFEQERPEQAVLKLTSEHAG